MGIARTAPNEVEAEMTGRWLNVLDDPLPRVTYKLNTLGKLDSKCISCGRSTPRSTEANRRLWALYQLIADNVHPDGKSYSRETWHYYFKGLFLGCTDIEMPNGRVRSEPNSTTELDKSAFCEYMTQIEVWAGERGVYLPE